MSSDQINVVMPIPNLTRFRRKKTGLAGFIERLRSPFEMSSERPVGAKFATETVYESFLKYHSCGSTFLMHLWDSNAVLGSSTTPEQSSRRLVVPSDLHELKSFVLFDPQHISPEMIDFRHGYLKRARPVVFSHHSLSYRAQLKHTFLPLLLSPTIPTDTVVCSSTAASAAFTQLLGHVAQAAEIPQERFRGRQVVIPYAVDTELFHPASRASARKHFGLPPDAFIVLMFGRKSPADKADLLPMLYEFQRLRSRLPRALLLIAGNARVESSDFLKDEIDARGLSEGVLLRSLIADNERVQLYNSADVFVSLSDNIQEAFGLSVIEAMSCGIPQIVSDWDGYRDLVQHGVTGFRAATTWHPCDTAIRIDGIPFENDFLYDHFRLAQSVAVDIQKVSSWLQLLAGDSELCSRLGEASRHRAIAEYSRQLMVDRYCDLFRDLLHQTHGDELECDFKNLYRVPAYYDCFSAYATYDLANSAPLLLDHERASMLLKQGMPYGRMFKLDPYEKWDIAAIIAKLAQAPGGMLLSDLVAHFSPSSDRELITRQILWLIKYGGVYIDEM